MRSTTTCAVLALLAATIAAPLQAQLRSQADDRAGSNELSVMAGLGQWLVVAGGNVAAQYTTDRWVLEYSHGWDLHYDRNAAFTRRADRDEQLALSSPWSTGGGAGYRLTPRLHLLVEPKAHRYTARIPGGGSASYTTYTLGPGLFYRLPLYKGLFLQPNVRWWPTIATSLDGDRVRIARADGSAYEHRAHELGLFANVNVGWTF